MRYRYPLLAAAALVLAAPAGAQTAGRAKTTPLHLNIQPDLSPAPYFVEEVRRYLLHLVHEKKLAWATYKQALAALRYLYRWVLKAPEIVQDIRCPRPERRLPVVPRQS